MGLNLPPKSGISAASVQNIPDKWSAEWFRSFITQFVQNADIRNTNAGTGISITPGPSLSQVGTVALTTEVANLLIEPYLIVGSPPAGSGITEYRSIEAGAGVDFTDGGAESTFEISVPCANPSATVGLAPVNGTAATPMRSDAAPALSQAITPTWTGAHSWSSTMAAAASPLQPNATQVMTGLANFHNADAGLTSNATLTADSALTVTCNQTGWYRFRLFIAVWEASSSAGGFQFDFDGGAAVAANFLAAVSGWGAAAIAGAAITSISTATAVATISTTAAAPSYVSVEGQVQITTAGTFGVRVAQNSSSANTTTIKAGSHFMLTKMG